MNRLGNLKCLLNAIDSYPNLSNLQTVRWRRKPRWLPIARSKLFRVPPRTVIPDEERVELMRLHNNYRTQIKAIRSYLHSEYNIKSVVDDTEEQEVKFLEEYAACSKINDAWNEKRKIEREAYHHKELEKAKELAYTRLDESMARKRLQLEKIELLVKKEKKAAQSFISMEELDTAIAFAIDNPVDYNYSIDLNGNFYNGRTTKPTDSAENKST